MKGLESVFTRVVSLMVVFMGQVTLNISMDDGTRAFGDMASAMVRASNNTLQYETKVMKNDATLVGMGQCIESLGMLVVSIKMFDMVKVRLSTRMGIRSKAVSTTDTLTVPLCIHIVQANENGAFGREAHEYVGSQRKKVYNLSTRKGQRRER